MFSARSQELDSLRRSALSAKLDEYFLAMEREGTDVQKTECDFLIESASDSLIRQFIAVKIYEHYFSSPVMGSEAVAIHVLDKWFLEGGVKMYSEIDLINARVYADFNRLSQIGMTAPQISMQNLEGSFVSLPKSDGRYSILYFYDTDCSKCKIQTILLRNFLEDKNYPIDLYAVYSGDNKSEWEDYTRNQLKIEASKTRIEHLWDPGMDSDFQRKYGVLQTPRMYLLRPDATIIGRGLDTEALMHLLRSIYNEVELNYGSDESARLFDGVLASEDGVISPSVEKVERLVDYIKDSTLQKGDTVMFRQLSGDLLYYLASRSGQGFKEGMKHLIDNNINNYPKVWKSADDSLKIIGFAQIMDDLLSKAEPGTEIPALKLNAESVRKGKIKSGKYDLSRLNGEQNIIVFYTEGCEICKAEKAVLKDLSAKDKKMKLLYVNVDTILASDPELADELFESFDLSSLPYIIQTDKKGRVVRRYLSYR